MCHGSQKKAKMTRRQEKEDAVTLILVTLIDLANTAAMTIGHVTETDNTINVLIMTLLIMNTRIMSYQ
jgi:hypothetical protein